MAKYNIKCCECGTFVSNKECKRGNGRVYCKNQELCRLTAMNKKSSRPNSSTSEQTQQ